jgi:glycosyltransferase involved in cell wall biosynthesis
VVSSYRRPAFLPELITALEAQTLPADDFEVVVVDNGSGDDTWSVLRRLCDATALRLQIARTSANRGPAGGRNLAVSLTRAPFVAFTDDDCLPTPGWLAAMLRASNGADIVQGRTAPDPEGARTSPWDRSVDVRVQTPFYETCNLGAHRRLLEQLGGFDTTGTVVGHRSARPFGEDAELGWRAKMAGARVVFEPSAVVHHRWLPGRYWDWLAERRQLGNFPALAKRSGDVAAVLWGRVFLTRSTAAFDLWVTAAVLGLWFRRPAVAVAGALPWLALRWPEARQRGGRAMPIRLMQVGLGDVVGMASLVEGSIRHRRVVL